jgi:hypothetical protein
VCQGRSSTGLHNQINRPMTRCGGRLDERTATRMVLWSGRHADGGVSWRRAGEVGQDSEDGVGDEDAANGYVPNDGSLPSRLGS